MRLFIAGFVLSENTFHVAFACLDGYRSVQMLAYEVAKKRGGRAAGEVSIVLIKGFIY
jgi:hypothetical protein